MRIVLCILLIAAVPTLARAGSATFYCDAAPVDHCVFTLQKPNGSVRTLAPVTGGEAVVLHDVSPKDSYCRAVNHAPDVMSCQREPVPMDADFKGQIMAPQ